MTDAAGSHREDDDQHIPGDTDLRALAQVLVAADRHEANDDMGHTEVSETPAEAGSNGLPVGEEVPVIRIGSAQAFHGHLALAAADKTQCKDGCNQQGAEHQQALEEVCPADSAETAHEGVADDDRRGDIHGQCGINTDDGVEQGAAGLDAGSGIDGIGNQEDHGTEDLQNLAGGFEPVGQVLGKSDGVICRDGKTTETGSLENPAECITDGQADRDPGLADTGGINGGGKTHQHPGAHIGGTGGKSGNPGTHFTAAKEVFLFTAATALHEEVDADPEHEAEIDNEDNQFRIHNNTTFLRQSDGRILYTGYYYTHNIRDIQYFSCSCLWIEGIRSKILQ